MTTSKEQFEVKLSETRKALEDYQNTTGDILARLRALEEEVKASFVMPEPSKEYLKRFGKDA